MTFESSFAAVGTFVISTLNCPVKHRYYKFFMNQDTRDTGDYVNLEKSLYSSLITPANRKRKYIPSKAEIFSYSPIFLLCHSEEEE